MDAKAKISKGQKTRQTVLDVAESLFGQRNFDGVSIRDVAQVAEMSLGAISYHFKSKEELFEETAARRAVDIERDRLALLEKLESPSPADILDAFCRPVFQRLVEPEWRNYLGMTREIVFNNRWLYLLERLFGPTVDRFQKELEDHYPGVAKGIVAHALYYVISLLVAVGNDTAHFDTVTHGAYSDNRDAAHLDNPYDLFLTFAVSGFDGLIGRISHSQSGQVG
jgi:AcrR family transcriptional regulator